MADKLTINLPINMGLQPPVFEFGIAGAPLYDYTWIFVMGVIGTFVLAAATGSNDVANSWATSVGSRTLKMWHAIVLASIMEFTGAFLLGSRTADVVKNKVISPAAYTNHEDLLMMGMMNVTWLAGMWNFLASYLEVNTSTTHSVIGAIVGFGLLSPSGTSAVDWNVVGLVVASWFAATALTAVLAALFFLTIRTFVLRKENTVDRAFRVFPIVVFYTLFINSFFIMYNGGVATGKGLSRVKISANEGVGTAIGIGAFFTLLTFFVVNPFLKRRIASFSDQEINNMFSGLILKEDLPETEKSNAVEAAGDDAEKSAVVAVDTIDGAEKKEIANEADSRGGDSPNSSVSIDQSRLDRFFRQNQIHSSIHHIDKVHSVHAATEKFPLRAEVAFGYLQVVTACFASFAHGSNDVGTFVGPLGGIYQAYTKGAAPLHPVGRHLSKTGSWPWVALV